MSKSSPIFIYPIYVHTITIIICVTKRANATFDDHFSSKFACSCMPAHTYTHTTPSWCCTFSCCLGIYKSLESITPTTFITQEAICLIFLFRVGCEQLCGNVYGVLMSWTLLLWLFRIIGYQRITLRLARVVDLMIWLIGKSFLLVVFQFFLKTRCLVE